MDVTGIQQALKAQGFDPGEVDGVWGRSTVAAVKAFQTARGLKADGVVGPATAKALAGGGGAASSGGATSGGAASGGDSSTPLVWFEEAVRLIGTKEKPGAGSNPELINWAKDLNIDAYTNDDIPWCGLFVAHCIGSTLPEEPLPNGPLMARNWLKLGQSCSPVSGAVLVFWRGSKTGSSLGHVGFYRGEDSQAYHVLGGNQSDMVNTARVGKDRLLGARWPRTAASLLAGQAAVQAQGSGKLSHNEA